MTAADDKQRLQELLRAGRFEEALPLLEAWLAAHPQQAPAWLWKAACLERLGRKPEALDAARTAARLAPTDQRMTAASERLERELAGSAPAVEATLREPTASQAAPAVQPTLVDAGPSASGGVAATLVEAGPQPAASAPATLAERSGGEVPATVAGTAEATLVEAASAPAAGWRVGELVEGRYEVRGSASGGMGTVYFVLDRELGLELAVKTPLPTVLASEAGRQRFLREAEAWVALGLHPHICAAYYVRVLGGAPRLFVEYLAGGTLEVWLKANQSAPLATRLDLAVQVAAGMHHAHTFAWTDEEGREHSGLVHRDLKPANVLLAADGTARVTDFGLVGRGAGEGGSAPAAAEDVPAAGGVEPTLVEGAAPTTGSVWATMTLGGRAMGTPPYMAPEQWSLAHAAGPVADVYAFGCLLYELFCGRRPFALEPRLREAAPSLQVAAWEHLHRSQPAPDPRSLRRDLDGELAQLLLACLEKEPARRPASFAELGARLRGIFERSSGSAYPRAEVRPAELLADSLNNRAVSFASLGQLPRAERVWKQALAADPQHAQATFNLVLHQWRHRGATDAAVAARLEEVRHAHTEDWRDDHLAGRADLCLGRYREALERLREAASGSGDAAWVVRDLALALWAVAASEPDDRQLTAQLLDLFRSGTLHADDDAAVLVAVAAAARRVGDEPTAAEVWGRARRLDPELAEELDEAARRLLPGAQLVRRLPGVGGRLHTLVVGLDGRAAVVGGEGGLVSIFDLRSGQLVRNLRAGGGRVRCLTLLEGSGSGLVATESGAVALFDLATGAPQRTLQLHTGYLNGLAASRDGRLVVGAGSAGILNVWSAASGKRALAVKVHDTFATCVALAPDGSLAATGAADGTVRLTTTSDGSSRLSFAAHQGAVSALAFGGGRLISAGEDGVARVWELADGSTRATLAGHGAPVRFAALSADGREALTASGSLRRWEVAGGEPLKAEALEEAAQSGGASADWGAVVLLAGGRLTQLDLRGVESYRPAWAVAAVVSAEQADTRSREFRTDLDAARRQLESHDFAAAVATLERARSISGYERSAKALELAARIAARFPRKRLRGAWEERVLTGHEGAVTAATLSPDGGHAVSAGRDRRLVHWDLATGTAAMVVDCPSVAVAVALAGDGSVLAAHLDNVVRRFELATGACSLELAGHEARVNAVATDPGGTLAVTASADGTARAWAAATGGCLHVLAGHLGQVTAAVVGPDATLAATGGDDGSLIVWDLSTGKAVRELAGHTKAIQALAWSGDGRHLLSASKDGSVRLFEVASGRSLRELREEGVVPSAVAFSPDGRFALVGGESGRLDLWELRTRQRVRSLEGHSGEIVTACLSRSGRRALSAAEDGSVRCWYLDWEPEVRPAAEWDESVRPYLNVFLARHRGADGRPEWHEGEVHALLDELSDRGLGWVSAAGVRRQLEEATAAWRPAQLSVTVEPTVRIATPRARAHHRLLRWRTLLAVALLVPALIGLNYLHARRQLRFSNRVKEVREHNLLLLLGPAQMAVPAQLGRVQCDPQKLERYIDDFTNFTDRPGDWMTANYCLEKLGDPRAVAPLLDLLRPRPEQPPPSELGMQIGSDPRKVMEALHRAMTGGFDTSAAVRSLLARLGERSIPNLVEAMSDPEPDVRRAAAGALALAASEQSIDALLEGSRSSSDVVRREVAFQLQRIAVSRRLDLADAFALLERMAGDTDAEVRANAARALKVFAGTRPAALAHRLDSDPDPRVREAMK